ncbi:MAG: bifunctional diaminohydroxyphosphoribosylaminopyrimidine deaminase/5-amino-6-(5-phosphoribosylamino)uracil reductase RibD [Alphaproteobacteria bacterium]
MASALGLARRGVGNVWPNPAVGCLIVQPATSAGAARIVGRGWTQPGGRPHAETEALARAGAAATDATAYVTLEPCCHHGRTPPCAEALIAAGIGRVVVACEDPDPRVAGKGIAALRAAGIEVGVGVGALEARRINEGFFSRIERRRPFVTLKIASTLDARIAARDGSSQWITGEAARARGHLLRGQHDAVLVGIGTAIADRPRLTCRLPGMALRQPVRVVMANRRVDTAIEGLDRKREGGPIWYVVGAGASIAAPVVRDETLIVADGADGRPDPHAVLRALAEKGITRLLIEGGRAIATAFLRAGLVDRIVWFRAPSAIGEDGLPALGALGVADIAHRLKFSRVSLTDCGDDVIEELRPTD